MREQIQELEKKAEEADARLREILTALPNLPSDSVPIGKSEADNVEARRWGAAPEIRFRAQAPLGTGRTLGVLDLERAAKLSGARFAVYWALGARLERALANFMLDLHTRQHGYTEVLPPYMVTPTPCMAPASCRNLRRIYSASRTAKKIFGSSQPPRSLLPISIATKPSTRRSSRSISPRTRRAFAARPALTERMSAALSASTNFKKSSW